MDSPTDARTLPLRDIARVSKGKPHCKDICGVHTAPTGTTEMAPPGDSRPLVPVGETEKSEEIAAYLDADPIELGRVVVISDCRQPQSVAGVQMQQSTNSQRAWKASPIAAQTTPAVESNC